MTSNSTSGLWARTALIWFLITMAFGMYMGSTHQFQYSPSHAHMGLLGWLSSAIFALLYAIALPGPMKTRAPQFHWALHNIGVATMTGSLFMLLSGAGTFWRPLISLGGGIVLIATLWLTLMLWPRLRAT